MTDFISRRALAWGVKNVVLTGMFHHRDHRGTQMGPLLVIAQSMVQQMLPVRIVVWIRVSKKQRS